MRHIFPLHAICLGSLALCSTAYAQTRPDAGQIQRQAQPEPGQKPLAPGAALPLLSPTTKTAPGLEGAVAQTIKVREVQISGSTLFSDATLRAAVGDITGKRSLAELQEAAARITARYNQAGYLLARAYLPAQRIENGVLQIAVLEGKLAKINLGNSSRLTDVQIQPWFSGTLGTPALRREVLDRKLLLLGDTPGIGPISARLAPGAGVGESEMNLQVQGTPAWNGRLVANNYGGRYNGVGQVGALVNADSLMGWGERISFTGLASEGELRSGQASIDVPIGTDGLRAMFYLGRTTYTLGDSFAALNASGTADNQGLALSYPLIRSAQQNLSLRLGAQHQALHDAVGSTGTQTDKSSRTASLRVQGDARDTTGVTLVGAGISGGALDIDSPSAAALDAAGAHTAGSFTKLVWNLERQQSVGDSWVLLASARGQQASKNLDSSEKLSLGGSSGVRAYAVGEAMGDQGWLLTLEARYRMNKVVFSAFYDQGHVEVNKNPFLSTPNGQDRSGKGIGVMGTYNKLDWSATVAWRGNQVGTAEPDKNPRAWVQVGWQF
jgi:hemolysin activation/secretion protein